MTRASTISLPAIGRPWGTGKLWYSSGVTKGGLAEENSRGRRCFGCWRIGLDGCEERLPAARPPDIKLAPAK
ncbi:hypothetical protein BHE74_00047272 [Ensete ventricosum]|nr:hypothetical protein GW17_00057301 [Ensete ventricosum]RWW46774.1 hypothetical protein BHE74_00047272 [Ensete ventricosum]